MNLCSDIRLKRNFTLIDGSVDILKKLDGYFHYWRYDEYPEWEFSEEREIGFKAQEVQQVLPEVVETMADGYLAIDYGKMVPLLVEAIKEQQAIIDNLASQLENQQLESQKKEIQFASLLSRIEQLENYITN